MSPERSNRGNRAVFPAAVTTLAAFALTFALSSQGDVVAQSVEAPSIVDAFYPAERLTPTTAAERQSCSAVLSTGSRQEPLAILAAYTNRATGAIRLLTRGAAGALDVAFDSPGAWLLPGSRCTVRLRDLDFDGRPEAFVYFHSVRSSAGWIFKWDGTALTNLTPTRTVNDQVSSLLLDPTAYDLDHRGALEIVAARDIERLGPTARSRNPAYVYRLGPSGLEVDRSLLAIVPYRGDVDPRSNLRSFRLAEDSTTPYVLRVVNGDRFGNHRVSGVTIRLNEVTVMEARDLTADTAFASVPIPSLAVQNHVTATLSGPPDATLLVLVEDATARR